MQWIPGLCLVLVGVIHLLPVAGVLGVERLQSLYGIRIDTPELALLMRHRAVLFGLLGAGLLVSALLPKWQLPALLAGSVSVVSFLLLALASPPYNTLIRRVVTIDLVALALLVVAGIMWGLAQRRG